jgi:hypothetical protein
VESVFLLSLVYPEKPENSVAKATKWEYVKKNTKKERWGNTDGESDIVFTYPAGRTGTDVGMFSDA